MMIRSATLDDIPAIAALHAQCFADAWSEQFLHQLLGQPHTFAFFVADSHKTIGFVLARAVGGESEILSLGVRPEARGNDLGTKLVQAAAGQAVLLGAHEIFLEVSTGNAAARALYKRLGFREVGQRPGYYREAGTVTDALTLRCALPL